MEGIMEFYIDLHVHSNASTHAYSTLEELVNAAKIKGLKGFALTNHGPILVDAPHEWHFGNLKVLPDYINGIRVYKGIETNIISYEGKTDLPEQYIDNLEIILAGFHGLTPYNEESTKEQNTETLINLINNGKTDVLAHMGNPKYPFDYEKVVKLASEKNVAFEINNSSFEKSRIGSDKNCEEILRLCKKYNTYISLGSDTHFSANIGNFTKIIDLFKKYEISQDRILNSDFSILDDFLKMRRK